MARAFEQAWGATVEGVVVTRHGPVEACEYIRVLTAAHPVPDEAGLAASAALLDAVYGLTEDDLVLALVSGGGSALLPAPPQGFTLDDEMSLNRALLASGAPIAAMNTIRRHFSRITGGRLALAAHPARVVTLVVSDVPGDDPALVASGPTVADRADATEALRLIRDYRMLLLERMVAHIGAECAPVPDDAAFARNAVHVIAPARVSLEAAAAAARASGVEALVLSDAIEGEARDIGRMHAAIARQFAGKGALQSPSCCSPAGR